MSDPSSNNQHPIVLSNYQTAQINHLSDIFQVRCISALVEFLSNFDDLNVLNVLSNHQIIQISQTFQARCVNALFQFLNTLNNLNDVTVNEYIMSYNNDINQSPDSFAQEIVGEINDTDTTNNEVI